MLPGHLWRLCDNVWPIMSHNYSWGFT